MPFSQTLGRCCTLNSSPYVQQQQRAFQNRACGSVQRETRFQEDEDEDEEGESAESGAGAIKAPEVVPASVDVPAQVEEVRSLRFRDCTGCERLRDAAWCVVMLIRGAKMVVEGDCNTKLCLAVG